MKENNDIEKLFRDKLSGHKADVPKEVWQGVQSGLSSATSAAGGASSAAGALSGAKITGALVTAAVAIGTVAGVIYFQADESPESTTAENTITSETTTEVQDKEDAAEHNPEEVQEETKTPAVESREQTQETTIETENKPEESAAVEAPIEEEPEVEEPTGKSAQQPEQTSSTEATKSESTKDEVGESEATPQSENVAEKIANNEFVPLTMMTPSGGTAPVEVEFSCDCDLERAKWEFGDGSEPSTNAYTTHTFTEPGTYVINFTGQKTDGEIFTESMQINVEAPAQEQTDVEKESLPPALINVPNVFTPNGDGVNDVLKVTAENVREYTLKIYNRGGVVVFETRDKDKVWEGQDPSGKPLPTGVYFYQIMAVGTDGNQYNPKGAIHLNK